DRPGTTVMDERLRVRPLVAAGGRVADVADRDLAPKPAEGLLRERLGDEPELAQRRRAAVVGDGDAGRFLSAVLQRVQAEIREAGDVAPLRADADDAAHLSRLPMRPRAPRAAGP